MTMHERRFRAMGTEVGVWLWSEHPDAEAAVEGAADMFEQAEQELSRFRKDSGLCKLNARAGKGPQRVSPMLAAVCDLALQAARETDGLFDPTVLPALLAAGYDGPFQEVLAASEMGKRKAVPRWETRSLWRSVSLGSGTIALPEGAGLDLGGIAKGWTVDQVAEELNRFGPALVDAGGDVRCTGRASGQAWPVAIADPLGSAGDLAQVDLGDEAVATSSVGKRRWRRGDEWLHHLIDPRSQRPSESDLHTVSVVAGSARAAEVLSKVALLLGSEAGEALVAARSASALLVLRDGTVRTVGDRVRLEK